MKRFWIPALLVTGALGACIQEPAGPQCQTLPTEVTATRGDTVTTVTGLRYIDTRAGSGTQALSCHTVTVGYRGSLTNGTVFDPGNEPLTFTIGLRELIPGFEQGVVGMKQGGTRRLIIPPSLGYGARGVGTIPPNSTLIFDIELRQVVTR